MRIAIVFPPESFGPAGRDLSEDEHLTGTDQVALYTMRELQARGHDVALYMPVGYPCEHAYPDISEWPQDAHVYDVAIAISNPNLLKHCGDKTLRVVNRQVGRFGADCDADWQEWTDLVICPSESAKRFVSEGLKYQDRFAVVPNGVYLPEADTLTVRTPGRCIYASSPDRGLHLLLSVWPRIRERVPHATLDVYYGALQSYLSDYASLGKRTYCASDEEHVRRAAYIRHALNRLAAHGVRAVGGVPHSEMVTIMGNAELMLYPAQPIAFTETFGCAVLEAMAHGCVPVISTADAFGELWAPHCPHVDAPVHENLDAYVELVGDLLSDPEARTAVRKRVREAAKQYAWRAIVQRLEATLEEARHRKAARVGVRDRGARHRSGDLPGLTTEWAERRISIVLTAYGSGGIDIDPENPYEAQTGGGCRTGFVGLTRAMARRGWHVDAYSTWTAPMTIDGVNHRPLHELEGAQHDVFMAYYDTTPLLYSKARLRIGSHHTFRPPQNTNEWEHIRLAPSQYTCDVMAPVYGGKWQVLPNAIPPGLPSWAPVPGRCLYHTSPDRGLPKLIELWPDIKRRVMFATMHVIGDVEGWMSSLRTIGSTQGEFARRLERAMPAAMAAGGVEFMGRVTRARMHAEIAQANCFPFWCDPAGPCETWSTSILECLAVGVPVVLRPADALASLWGGIASLVSAEDTFVEHVVSRLTDLDKARLWSDVGRRDTAIFTFDNTAKRLEEIISAMGRA